MAALVPTSVMALGAPHHKRRNVIRVMHAEQYRKNRKMENFQKIKITVLTTFDMLVGALETLKSFLSAVGALLGANLLLHEELSTSNFCFALL